MPLEFFLSSSKDVLNWAQEGYPCGPLKVQRAQLSDIDKKLQDVRTIQVPSLVDVPGWLEGRGFNIRISFGPGGQRPVMLICINPDPTPEAKESSWLSRVTDDTLLVLSRFHPQFAYACTWDETCHRNVLEIDVSWSRRPCTMPVGLDISRYVPGLYWKTYFAYSYLKAHRIDVAQVARAVRGDIRECAEGCLLTLYDSPIAWRQRAPVVDEFLLQESSFFSKLRIVTRRIQSMLEISDYTRNMSDEWP